MNLEIGTVCSAREHFLATVPVKSPDGEKYYSALMVDFRPEEDADGRRWHSWTLKPEAEAALRHLGVLGAAVEAEEA